MDHTITALERAFQLAKSGDYGSVPDIKRRLIREGYSVAAITGGALSKQLLALIRGSRSAARRAKAT
jgi:phosphohistidine phosphatase SixA